ncbi:hypothetical protein, partial [Microbacterium sp. KNMS]
EAGALLQNLLSAHTNPARHVTFTETRDRGDDGPDGDDALSNNADGGGDGDGGGADTDGEGGFFDGIDPETRNDTDPWGPDEIIHDPRTPGQKRHDAFFAMIQAASRAAETPTLGGAAPT